MEIVKATSTKFMITYSFRESFRRKCYFFLCLFACFLVCLVSLISKTVLSQGPVIFLMLAEQKSGETDIILRPTGVGLPKKTDTLLDYKSFYNLFNYTKLVEETKAEIDISKRSSGRINYLASVGMCEACDQAMADVNIINTEKERQMELGRTYPYPKLKSGECVLHRNIIDKLKINPVFFNETIWLTVNFNVPFFNILLENYYENTTHAYNKNITSLPYLNTIVFFPCQLVHIIEQNHGKVDENNKKLAIMEADNFTQYIAPFISQQIVENFSDFPAIFSKALISDYSTQVIINFEEPRINSYLISSMDDLQYKGVTTANKIAKSLGQEGRNYVKISMPLIDTMKPLFYGSIFLGLILNVIIVILFALSLILIHSLLVITTETNSFDFGILRMLGTNKKGVVLITVFQCLAFSIPACLLAYLAHFYILSLISDVLAKYTENTTKFGQDFYSVVYSIIICNLAPLIAAIFPIKNLLNKNLAFALNTNFSQTSGVSIQITSAADKERTTLITFGLLTFLYGASIYYFLPLSLLSFNLNLLLVIFLWILLGILVGLIVLSLNIENILQKIFTYLFLFFSSSYTKLLILKNLTTHRIRNRQTSLMYALSVGFFIMITVGLDIELKSITLQQLSRKGAYIELENSGDNILKPYHFYDSMKKLKELNAIQDYTFISNDLGFYCFGAIKRIMNIGKSMDFRIDLFALSPNFFEVAEKVFLKVDEDANEKLNIPFGEKLYLSENDSAMGISGIVTWEIDTHTDDVFYFNIQKGSDIISLVFKPSLILHSAPALRMSAEPSTMYQRAAIVPIHTYLELANKCRGYYITERQDIGTYSFADYPINRVLLKINPDVNPQEAIKNIRETVYNDPKYFVKDWYLQDYEKNITKISGITNIIFSGVSVIVLIFCFFNLSASMSINIFEQRKEIAILRSLGMTSKKILFIYICEGFILIFTASFIGLVIGSLISWTMTLQRVIFTNLPLHFNFPYTELGLLVLTSVIGGLLSTIFPARALLKSSISDLIRK